MFKVPNDELRRRLDKLGEIMEKNKLDGLYITNATTFKYLINYFYIQTERPAALLVDRNLDVYFLGPIMEEEHVLSQSNIIKGTMVYPDYPGESHPFKHFANSIHGIIKGKCLGVDNSRLYPEISGFRGIPPIEVLPNIKLVDLHRELYDMRKIKSPIEQELLRESSRWGNLAQALLQKYTEPGKYGFEVSSKATNEAKIAATEMFAKHSKPPLNYPLDIYARITGAVGPHSYHPHSLTIDKELKLGDILISDATGNIEGYHTEIERNMFLGKPDEKTTKFHKLSVEMQAEALRELQIGRRCSDIDKAVVQFAKEHGVLKYRLHHSGHGIGLDRHEAPFLDVGDNTVIEAGMVFSIEPGIYIKKLGGFRHSDTVIMHEYGPELITYYPNETEELTINR